MIVNNVLCAANHSLEAIMLSLDLILDVDHFQLPQYLPGLSFVPLNYNAGKYGVSEQKKMLILGEEHQATTYGQREYVADDKNKRREIKNADVRKNVQRMSQLSVRHKLVSTV